MGLRKNQYNFNFLSLIFTFLFSFCFFFYQIMKWRSYLCVSVWKNSREGETAWKRETKQAKKLRETEREREKRRKKEGNRDGLVSRVVLATAAREQRECFIFMFFLCFPGVCSDEPGCDIGGLAVSNVCECKQSARLVIWAVEPGSWSLDIWRRCSLARGCFIWAPCRSRG